MGGRGDGSTRPRPEAPGRTPRVGGPGLLPSARDMPLPDHAMRRASSAVLVAALVLFAVLRAPYFSVPLERDEGEYAYIAQRMLAGEPPYTSAFDQKPPAVFLVYALAFSLFGQSIEAVRGLLHLWTLGSLVLLHVFVRRLAGALAAAFAALAFAISSTDPGIFATAANTEIFLLLPVLGSMVCLSRALERPRAIAGFAACGALAGAACWFKPVAAVHALFLAIAAAVAAWRLPVGERLGGVARAELGLVVGAAAVSAPFVVFLVASGAWGAFVDAVVVHNLAYSTSLDAATGARVLAFMLAHQAPGFGVLWLLAGAALVLPSGASPGSRALLAGFAASSAAAISIGFHYRFHYFVQLLPPLCALAGISAAALAKGAAGALGRAGAAAAPAAWAGTAVAVAAVAVPPIAASWPVLRAGPPEAVSRAIYGMNPFPESLAIADYIERTSEPGETVYVVGSEPQILFYARRRSATRYIFFYPLTGPYPDALDRQRELVAEVRASRPRYVVWVELQSSLLLRDDTERTVFEASARLLEREYALELVARPRDDGSGFELLYGGEARRAFRAAQARGEPLAWVAVYRRTT